jgi:hypothetical protein
MPSVKNLRLPFASVRVIRGSVSSHQKSKIKVQQSSLDNPFTTHPQRHPAEKWVRRAAGPYLNYVR